MLRTVRNGFLAAAATGLLIAQPAMATRSAGSLPSTSATLDGQRVGSDLRESEDLRGGFIIPLVAIIAVILGILAATGGGNDSPG